VVVTTDDGPSPTGAADEFQYRLLNVVQLGDSIASGEGINYGFTYNPTTRLWTLGNPSPVWDGPYQDCHVSSQAYGDLVAAALDNSPFTTFACTGATYANGVVGPETLDDASVAPPQFGDWESSDGLNAAYDAANPDVVLVSLGADDIQFAAVVTSCIKNALAYAAAIATNNTPPALVCVKSNPGPVVESDYFGALPGVATNLTQLANDITARGAASDSGIIPKVVFNDYYNPFPSSGRCPDTGGLQRAQISYLSSLVLGLDTKIKGAIDAVSKTDTNVGFAELKDVLNGGHQWCSSDPEAYGLSIEVTSLRIGGPLVNPAPFHPTPAGQGVIAGIVSTELNTLLTPAPKD
jgi:hypothetical protein